MHAALHRPTLYQQLEALPDTVVGEILDGQLYAHPRPAPKHQTAATALAWIIGPVFGDRYADPGGWRILCEPEIHFLRKTEVDVPDLAGWQRARMADMPATAHIEIIPDWVCEVLSPTSGTTDRQVKMPIYARFGVPYAWLIDPDAQTLAAYRLLDGAWQEIARFSGTATVAAAPFETLSFDLSRLWD